MFYQLVGVVSLFAYTTTGVDTTLNCPRGELCLTSFKSCDSNQSQGCSAPPGSYPWTTRQTPAQLPALLDGTDYTISWMFGPDGKADVPVWIQWQMDGVVWGTNATGTQYIFNPGKILASFPTPQAPNMTTEAAWFSASHQRGNVLIISQPGAVWVDNRVPTAFSQPFTVQSLIFKDYIQTQIEISRQTEYNKWRLGVSIGLGIGVPFLMFITTVGVLAISGMQARKQLDNEVEIFPNEPSIY